ncbi:MAG TPA: diacylglycerol kinase family protein [Conexibacter sp.]|jgi:diacylglycerol kinase family enzyme
MSRPRLAAMASLLLLTVAVAGAVAIAVAAFPRGLFVVGFVALGAPLAWWGAVRQGIARWVALALAVALLVAAVALVLLVRPVLPELGVVVALALAVSCGRAAFAVHADLPTAPRPQRPVVFWNPKSGGGKATKANLAEEARKRGIEPIELQRDDDLGELVRRAVAGGADAVGAAGGDGTQAIIAAAAAEHGLPYACIPAGTRNHFALDLGVDRDDVVGALDAFVNGRERRVDLAEVNGQVFVNNVSLGVYAEAVQREGYREAKLRTISRTVPDTVGPGGAPLDLRWNGPDGRERATGAVILVSNNCYRLRPVGSGTRPRMDGGELGIAVFGGGSAGNGGVDGPLLQWAQPQFEIRSDAPVPTGIDGEAVVLQAPVRFTTRPGALAVRIAPHHPGASPSAGLPDSPWLAVTALMRVASGHGGPGASAPAARAAPPAPAAAD